MAESPIPSKLSICFPQSDFSPQSDNSHVQKLFRDLKNLLEAPTYDPSVPPDQQLNRGRAWPTPYPESPHLTRRATGNFSVRSIRNLVQQISSLGNHGDNLHLAQKLFGNYPPALDELEGWFCRYTRQCFEAFWHPPIEGAGLQSNEKRSIVEETQIGDCLTLALWCKKFRPIFCARATEALTRILSRQYRTKKAPETQKVLWLSELLLSHVSEDKMLSISNISLNLCKFLGHLIDRFQDRAIQEQTQTSTGAERIKRDQDFSVNQWTSNISSFVKLISDKKVDTRYLLPEGIAKLFNALVNLEQETDDTYIHKSLCDLFDISYETFRGISNLLNHLSDDALLIFAIRDTEHDRRKIFPDDHYSMRNPTFQKPLLEGHISLLNKLKDLEKKGAAPALESRPKDHSIDTSILVSDLDMALAPIGKLAETKQWPEKEIRRVIMVINQHLAALHGTPFLSSTSPVAHPTSRP